MPHLPLLIASTSNNWTCAGIALFTVVVVVTLGGIARRARAARVWP